MPYGLIYSKNPSKGMPAFIYLLSKQGYRRGGKKFDLSLNDSLKVAISPAPGAKLNNLDAVQEIIDNTDTLS